MAERERALAPPYGGVFVARTTVMDAEEVRRATWRMAHEIIERNHSHADLVLIGLQTGGVWIASRLARVVGEVTGHEVVVGTLDVAFYRDDYGLRPVLPEAATEIPVDLTRPDGGAGRRRAVHRADHPGRPGRAQRLRPGPGRAAGGDGRPGPPGAADPAGLRGPQPADPARRDGRRERGRAWSSATCGRDDPASAVGLRPRAPTGSRRSSTSPTASSR